MDDSEKQCAQCGETIKSAALICRYCNYDQTVDPRIARADAIGKKMRSVGCNMLVIGCGTPIFVAIVIFLGVALWAMVDPETPVPNSRNQVSEQRYGPGPVAVGTHPAKASDQAPEQAAEQFQPEPLADTVSDPIAERQGSTSRRSDGPSARVSPGPDPDEVAADAVTNAVNARRAQDAPEK